MNEESPKRPTTPSHDDPEIVELANEIIGGRSLDGIDPIKTGQLLQYFNFQYQNAAHQGNITKAKQLEGIIRHLRISLRESTINASNSTDIFMMRGKLDTARKELSVLLHERSQRKIKFDADSQFRITKLLVTQNESRASFNESYAAEFPSKIRKMTLSVHTLAENEIALRRRHDFSGAEKMRQEIEQIELNQFKMWALYYHNATVNSLEEFAFHLHHNYEMFKEKEVQRWKNSIADSIEKEKKLRENINKIENQITEKIGPSGLAILEAPISILPTIRQSEIKTRSSTKLSTRPIQLQPLYSSRNSFSSTQPIRSRTSHLTRVRFVTLH